MAEPVETRSTCPYCGVGCGVLIESRGSEITGVRGDPEHPANRGRLCSKGHTLALTAAPHLAVQVRALQPMRRATRGAALHAVGWDEALDEVANRFAAAVAAHGPDAVGFYLSGQLLTEDYHVFNKLAKGLVGTNNVDTNSRLCMSSAVAGYKASLGADAVPACYEDIDLADTVFITGSNTALAHPVLYRRLEAAREARPAMRVIVVDPRRTETAAEATLHLQIQPGTDVILHHAMLHVMLWEGLVDAAFVAAHTTGFEQLRDRVREFTPAHAAKVCGVKAEDIVTAARWFAGLDAPAGSPASAASAAPNAPTTLTSNAARRPTLSLWCQGLNQSASGTDKNTTLINLHLATGQIGKPGAGPLSLTGQPNAMGGREVGGLANLLPGHREVANAEHRAEVAALWGVKALPATQGLAAMEMFEAAAAGRLKALWIVCTNPAQSLPDQALVRRALQRCEFVVVQEAYRTTATVAYADVLLPAASWGEKEGTVTNSERCISRVRAAVPGAGDARPDWAIAVAVARRLEAHGIGSDRRAAVAPGVEAGDTDVGDTDSQESSRPHAMRRDAATGVPPTLFPFESAESIWLEHRESTRGRDLDITGLSYSLLEAAPRQWPWPQAADEAIAPSEASGAVGAIERDRARGGGGAGGVGGTHGEVVASPSSAAAAAAAAAAAQRLYLDHRFATPDGRARFAAPAWRGTADARDAHYPVSLTTGRLRDHWHGMSRTGTLGRLFAQGGAPAVELHPQELARRQWREGTLVQVRSRRGSLVLPVRASEAVAPAQAFVAMHWGGEWLPGGEALGVNALMPTARCPQSRQPELKHAAVRLAKADLPWALAAAAWLPAARAHEVRERLRPVLAALPYAALWPFGQEGGAQHVAEPRPSRDGPAEVGLLLRGAAATPLGEAELAAIAAALGLGAEAPLLRYRDDRQGHRRMLHFAESGELAGYVLAGETAAAIWMQPWLEQRRPARAGSQAMLANRATPPAQSETVRPREVVCSCNDVDAAAIASALKAAMGTALNSADGVAVKPAATAATAAPDACGAARDAAWDDRRLLEQLKGTLRCGTTCGSCLPAVKALMRQHRSTAALATQASTAAELC